MKSTIMKWTVLVSYPLIEGLITWDQVDARDYRKTLNEEVFICVNLKILCMVQGKFVN